MCSSGVVKQNKLYFLILLGIFNSDGFTKNEGLVTYIDFLITETRGQPTERDEGSAEGQVGAGAAH